MLSVRASSHMVERSFERSGRYAGKHAHALARSWSQSRSQRLYNSLAKNEYIFKETLCVSQRWPSRTENGPFLENFPGLWCALSKRM